MEIINFAYRLKDARYIRKKTVLTKDTSLQENIKKRKKNMNSKENHLQYQLIKEREGLYIAVIDALEKAVLQRRKEFHRLWTKYVKVSRCIDNLQQKENFRLKNLESIFLKLKCILEINLDEKKYGDIKSKKRIKNQRTVKYLGGVGLVNKKKLKNKKL